MSNEMETSSEPINSNNFTVGSVDYVKKMVLALLDRKPYSRAELARKLEGKLVPEAIQKQVLDLYEELGLINDLSYANSLAHSHREYRHRSTNWIRQDLRRRGLTEEIINQVLVQADNNELDAAWTFTQKKLTSINNLSPIVIKRRLSGALARRGFNNSTISEVLYLLDFEQVPVQLRPLDI